MSHLPWFDHWICWSLLGGSIMGQWGESRKVQSWPIRSKEFVKQQLSFDGFCSPWLMMVHGERSNGGWKVQTRWELEGSHCHKKLGLADELLWLARVLLVWVSVLWMTVYDDDWRCGDSRVGQQPSPAPGRQQAGPCALIRPLAAPARVFIEAAPDYRWSKASDDSWSKISLHRLYWNPELTWTLNQ